MLQDNEVMLVFNYGCDVMSLSFSLGGCDKDVKCDDLLL